MNGSEKNDVGFVPASGYFCLHLRNGEVLDREPIVGFIAVRERDRQGEGSFTCVYPVTCEGVRDPSFLPYLIELPDGRLTLPLISVFDSLDEARSWLARREGRGEALAL